MSGSTSNNYIGSGSDTINLTMSEDQAQGVDAQFTVNVDGQQIGGLQSVSAQRSSGQEETYTFAGNFNPGSHNVTVTFANNFIYPGQSGDRNLYVDNISYDGQTVSNKTTPIYESPIYPPNSGSDILGNAVFQVNDTTSVPSGAPSTQSSTPGPISVGSGPDTLVLNMGEDAFQGDAQFTVSVDGKQIGGTQTTTALVAEGQQQEFDVHGNFGGGSHNVTVNYLNDSVGGYYPAGTPGLPPGTWALDTEDRNLYVMGMSLNGGSPASGTPWELSSSGSFSWNVQSGSNSSPSTTATTSSTPATTDTATVTSDSLTTGGSSMSFVSSPTTSSGTTSSSGSTNSGSTSSGTASPATTTTTPTVADTVSSSSQTTQDFTVPSMSSSSTGNTTSSPSGMSGHWWANHSGDAGTYIHHHG
jgi:hypothetical protein